MRAFALVDCNNFYASCERVFNPALEGRPIVILSNNDGCIVARSNEAKALGIGMAAPYYQCKALCEQHNVAVFSSNYELYGDMSQRVMQSLRRFCVDMEIYSIDEAFLMLEGASSQQMIVYAQKIHTHIKQWTGIPVSIGIAPTKTLAKMANYLAKKHFKQPVMSLLDPALQENILSRVNVEDIWGISRGRAQRLRRLGIFTAKQLRDAEAKAIRKHLTVIGERMVYELRGTPCLLLEDIVGAKKNIMSSRSFGYLLTTQVDIAAALANYTAHACQKLRQQKSRAQAIGVFLRTNRFCAKDAQYRNEIVYRFVAPTNDTREIIALAKKALSAIYQPGYAYQKVGIILMELVPDTYQQQDLLCQTNYQLSDKLMAVLDNINFKMGKKGLFIAAQGTNRPWLMRCDKRSPRYTTCWDELPRVC